MAARDILKNFNLFIDGRGYAGRVDEYSPPDLAIQGEEFRAGGMDVPITLDMGQEAMEASFILSGYDYDALALWGVAEGQQVAVTARGALENYDGTVTPIAHYLRGKVKTIAGAAWTPGQKAPVTFTLALDYFKSEHGGRVIHEIDAINMIRVVNGTDRLAAQRAALGM